MRSVRKQFTRQSGQTLIEALLALIVVIVIITAVVTAVITSLSGATFTKNQNLASQYAQEGIDIARNMKDSDFASFSALNNDQYYCAAQGSTSLDSSSCSTKLNGIFTRKIYINHNGQGPNDGASVVKKCPFGTFVSSIVSWSDPKCGNSGVDCHSVKLDSCFDDLNKVPNP